MRAVRHAALAQSVEHFTRNEKVASSILAGSSERRRPSIPNADGGPSSRARALSGPLAPGKDARRRAPCRMMAGVLLEIFSIVLIVGALVVLIPTAVRVFRRRDDDH